MSARDFQPEQQTAINGAVFVDAYRWMYLARAFEDKIGALFRAGKVVGGVYLGRGQEAFSVSLGMQLERSRGDIFGALIRDQEVEWLTAKILSNQHEPTWVLLRVRCAGGMETFTGDAL